jgi:anthranilate phosphoribosyltransferase
MQQFLEKLLYRENLPFDEMVSASRNLFSEETTDSEMGAFLAALKLKGETPDEIAGLVEAIREKSVPIRHTGMSVMDNCGTGGDRSLSFNISTTSAFVIAGAGIKVAKHGNRSVSSRTGSADVLEHLGISLSFPPDAVEELLNDNGIAFLFAPYVHPALKRIMKIRKDLKVPTVFNLIGPLTNPLELDTQLVGIYDRSMLDMMAKVLQKMGRKRALIVNGAGFMDEASLSGENHLVLLEKGKTTPLVITPEDVGLPVYEHKEIIGGGAKENAAILLGVLQGKKGAYRDTVLLNAGLAIFANGAAKTIQEGINMARESIDSGAAESKLQYLVNYSSKLTHEVI